ncbi:MAG: Fic family protein [Alphaproteobacteria bacterium]|nr:Fic family protein [Alphaproteobacteria bacterium]
MNYKKLLTLSYTDEKEYQEVYKSRINSESTTLLDFEISGNQAFYVITQEILMLVTKIASVDKDLGRKMTLLPNIAIQQYTRQILIDEIKQTNDIENVFSTKKQIKDTLSKIEKNSFKGRFNGLIRKYQALEIKADISLNSCDDIRKLYDEIVLPEVIEEDPTDKPDGIMFRKESVSVYSESGKEIHVGSYPEAKIISNLTSALKILNDENVNYLVSAAVFHYLFAYIHPFYNGNGRTDRFISSYYVSKYLNPLVAYRLSYIIKKHKSQYYKMFTDTNDKRNKGDLTPFIIQFLEFVLEVEKELCEEIENRVNKTSYYTMRLKELSLTELDDKIAFYLMLNALFDTEGLSISRLQIIVGKSYNTVKKSIDRLQEMNLLRTETSGKSTLYEIDLNKI